MAGLSTTETWLRKALNGGLDETYAQLETELRERLEGLEQEKTEALARAKFSLDLITAIRHRTERVVEISQETQERKRTAYQVLTEFGFRPELINPNFYLYVSETISQLAEMGILPKDRTKEDATRAISLTAEDVADMFKIPEYGEQIGISEALFCRVEDVLRLCGDDPIKKKKALAKIRRTYARHLHPDQANADKILAERLFKIGWPFLEEYRDNALDRIPPKE